MFVAAVPNAASAHSADAAAAVAAAAAIVVTSARGALLVIPVVCDVPLRSAFLEGLKDGCVLPLPLLLHLLLVMLSQLLKCSWLQIPASPVEFPKEPVANHL